MKKSSNRMMSAQVTAHHRNEEFRPYKIRFVNKGSFRKNLAHVLVKAILKEGDWMGWFQRDEGVLHGLEKEIRKKVTDLALNGDPKKPKNQVVIFGYDPHDDQPKKVTDVSGLVVWIDETDKSFNNYGFGWGTRRSAFGNDIAKEPLSDDHTDKNDNRWIEF